MTPAGLTSHFFRGAKILVGIAMVMRHLSTQVPTGIFIFLKAPCCFQTVTGNVSGQWSRRTRTTSCPYSQRFNSTPQQFCSTPTAWPTFSQSFMQNYLLYRAQAQLPHPESSCYGWLIIMQEFLASLIIKNVPMSGYFSSIQLPMLSLRKCVVLERRLRDERPQHCH